METLRNWMNDPNRHAPSFSCRLAEPSTLVSLLSEEAEGEPQTIQATEWRTNTVYKVVVSQPKKVGLPSSIVLNGPATGAIVARTNKSRILSRPLSPEIHPERADSNDIVVKAHKILAGRQFTEVLADRLETLYPDTFDRKQFEENIPYKG